MTASWNTQVSWDPPLVGVAIYREWRTVHLNRVFIYQTRTLLGSSRRRFDPITTARYGLRVSGIEANRYYIIVKVHKF
ncbi:MAG TPA: hypothetical protein ENK81_03330 [Euryarchaeota archaeon]|nr:hypothetical protein [Euryarchaeota archaeon]